MERLTEPRHEYHSCDFMDDGVYIDMNRLREYEDTGFTPEQILELKEPIGKLQKYFGDTITAGQVIDFFMDYYIAQGDPKQVEDAVLLTNEDAARYRELNKRDIGVKPIFSDGWDMCGNCGERITPVETRSSRDNDGWIPVEERLPIPNKEIWVTVKRNGKVFVSDDSMTEKGHFWNYEKENILAWKEKETIPEPYCPERIENTWKEDLLKKFDRRK